MKKLFFFLLASDSKFQGVQDLQCKNVYCVHSLIIKNADRTVMYFIPDA